MAEFLASIYGSEKDKVNCSFYFKIGACRHGDRCSRLHIKPHFSSVVLLQNFWQNPLYCPNLHDGKAVVDCTPVDIERAFEEFYEDVFLEMGDKYGEIEEIHVCDNQGDHLLGNVYIKFRFEEDASKAVEGLNNRWFAGRVINAELSPVSDFRESICRQYEQDSCTRGSFCNFMHIKPIVGDLRHRLYANRPFSYEIPGGGGGGGRGYRGGGGGGGGGGGYRRDYGRDRDYSSRDRDYSRGGGGGGGGGGYRSYPPPHQHHHM